MSMEVYRDEREMLQGIIELALEKGWKPRDKAEKIVEFDVYKYGLRKVTFFTEDMVKFQIPVYEIIFNHNFAKALFGEGENLPSGLVSTAGLVMLPKWKSALKSMVLSDNPIKYAWDNIQ